MAHILLAIYLILVGLTVLFGLTLPSWIAGILALAAGILMLASRLGLRIDQKRPD
ncbi:MAG: hypothetical protein JWM88_2275 [Verrucomicrobia bacterium]|nr:hypothetical protein [Verrucomicrobiota bacterium]